MSPPPVSGDARIAATAERVRRWWWHLNPQRQDRLAVLAPLAAVLLFLAAIIAAFGYLRLEEIDREHEAVKRDVEYTQQRLRLRLLERQEQLMRIARDISNHELDADEFHSRAEALVNQYPDLERVSWIDERKRIKSSYSTASLQPNQPQSLGETLRLGDTLNIFTLARELQQPVYSQRAASGNSAPFLQLHIPLTDKTRFAGVVLAEYSVDGLYRYGVPTEVSARYAISLLDDKGIRLAGTSVPVRNPATSLLPWVNPVNEYEVPVSPVGNGLVLRAQAYRTSLGVIGSGLFWLVGVLSAMTAWMLIANFRHTRRRQ
ncbi:MAG: PAS domain-containing sensor histidine kinase, partial [Burkholderiaceae bacterium]